MAISKKVKCTRSVNLWQSCVIIQYSKDSEYFRKPSQKTEMLGDFADLFTYIVFVVLQYRESKKDYVSTKIALKSMS